MKLTPAQLKKIWVIATKVGLSEDELHGLVLALTGSDSVGALSTKQAHELINYLVEMEKGHLKLNELLEGAITPAQKDQINHLLYELGWFDKPQQAKEFLKKITGKDTVYQISRLEASKVIAGLKNLLRVFILSLFTLPHP